MAEREMTIHDWVDLWQVGRSNATRAFDKLLTEGSEQTKQKAINAEQQLLEIYKQFPTEE